MECRDLLGFQVSVGQLVRKACVETQGEQGVQGTPSGGVTYTRWGRTTCPTDQGTELVYAGRTGGTHYQHSGGGANHLCMTDDPDHLQYQSGVQGWSHITGVEYWHSGLPPYSSVNYNNVPCAVVLCGHQKCVTDDSCQDTMSHTLDT